MQLNFDVTVRDIGMNDTDFYSDRPSDMDDSILDSSRSGRSKDVDADAGVSSEVNKLNESAVLIESTNEK